MIKARSNAWITPTVIGFLLRWGYAAFRNAPLADGGDAATYLAAAEWLSHPSLPFSFGRPPGFPLFLSFSYVLPGHHAGLFFFLHALLGAATIALIFHFAQRLISKRAAIIAAWVTALDPFLIFYTGIFMAECLFTLTQVAAFYFLSNAERRNSNAAAIGAGVLCTYTGLTRSLFLPLTLFLALGFFLVLWKRPERSFRLGFVFTGAFLLTMGLWATFVHHHIGRWMIAAPQKGVTAYEGLNPDFESREGVERWQEGMWQDVKDKGITDPLERDTYFLNKTREYIRSHPKKMLHLMLRKLLKFWRPVPYADYYNPSIRLVSALFMIPLLGFGAVGILWCFYRWRTLSWELKFIVVYLAAYSALNTLTWTQIRYRVPLDPFVALLATLALPILRRRSPGETA